jgi:NADH-quinone oxidoreductase subunit D
VRLIGNAERVGLFGRGRQRRPTKRFFAVDGGAGAHIVANLAHVKPGLRRVASPRHANLLLIVSPLSPIMREPVVELARGLAKPSRAIVIDTDLAIGQVVDTGSLLAEVEHVSSASVDGILRRCFDEAVPPFELSVASEWHPDSLDLSNDSTEIETEEVVLSLGPSQPYTAGPLRMLLVCDGEQIVRAELRTRYAYRGVAEAIVGARWKEAAEIAATLDPLAPFAGRLAFVRAVETLQDKALNAERTAWREGILARERVRNTLWWFVRFADLLGLSEIARHAHGIAVRLDEGICVAPDKEKTRPRLASGLGTDVSKLVHDVETLARHVTHDRLIALRCKGIGLLGVDEALRHGISGPSLAASRHGNGDAHARLVARLAAAGSDLRNAANAKLDVEPGLSLDGTVPAGTVQVAVEGPRGTIGLTLRSDGGECPARVEWRRPSAALLKVLPDVLKGQIVADAEVIVASFDIAMAEADG